MKRNSPIGASRSRAILALVLAIVCVAGGTAAAQGRAPQAAKPDNAKVHVMHVQGNVYMLVEPDLNNITVQVGETFIVIVDTGVAELGDDAIAAIQSVSDLPILFIANTSSDPDHIGGNAKFSAAGWALPNADAPGRDPEVSAAAINARLEPGATIIGHANTMTRVIVGNLAKNTSVTYGDEGSKIFNKEPVIFAHVRAAHTDGDTTVFFRGSEVLSAGEIFSPMRYPDIETDKGGTLNGEIDALNDIIALMVPKDNEEGGTYIIPGHGWLCDRNDVVNYRDMLTIIRGRVQDMVRKGMKLDQVKAAKPSFDYDPLYGASTGPWSPDKFIETVYHEVAKDKVQQGKN
ncbi:MAG: MBL fold metallo-hydrolase [Candidatus Acidiferrales bacterium]|jgi:glyoxylase-like metal-dependent hydrolase (beta-lactamase superfamily II)